MFALIFAFQVPSMGFAQGINENEEVGHEDIVQLSKAEMTEFGIKTAIVASGTLHLEIIVPGEIAVNYDRLAHIAPRFPGVVIQVNKHLGDKVHKGDVLAIIESNEGLVPYEVQSLLDGTIIEKHITIGEVRSIKK
jgi:cobalt-zinc-cadmium efflux system membrane fusion protein